MNLVSGYEVVLKLEIRFLETCRKFGKDLIPTLLKPFIEIMQVLYLASIGKAVKASY